MTTDTAGMYLNYREKLNYDTNFIAGFNSILGDLFKVFQNADRNTKILTTSKLPVGLFEKDSEKILLSYKKAIGGKGVKYDNIKSRFDKGRYDSPYKLYHDIKVASAAIIEPLKLGSEEYKEIDFFYRFTTELLLQEVGRLHLTLLNHEKRELEPASDIFNLLSEDYDRISYSYTATNDEMVTYISKTEEPDVQAYSNLPGHFPAPTKTVTQPLFSSLLYKSSLDTNPTFVPDPYLISKVVPINKNQARNTNTLFTISQSSSHIPTPLDQLPSALLKDFFHPIWYTIPVPTWLNYKSSILKPSTSTHSSTTATALSSASNGQTETPKLLVLQNRNSESNSSASYVVAPGESVRSFASNVDLTDTIVTEDFKSRIWLQQLGSEEIQKIKKKYLELNVPISNETKEESEDVEMDLSDAQREDSIEAESKVEDVRDADLKVEVANDDDYDKSAIIDVANLLEWDPLKVQALDELIEEKKTTFESPQALQRHISTLLIKLNRLRQERYLKGETKSIAVPSNGEIKIYNKLTKLIEISIKLYNVKPSDFSIEFSKKLPVLSTEFCGTLPIYVPVKPPPQYNPPQYSGTARVPTIRGPYKKKNKNL